MYNVDVCIAFSLFVCKQRTAYEMRISDWSSEVCSSDLPDRLADPQASAIEQQQHRPVARADPRLGGVFRDLLGQRDRLVGRDRAWHALLDARPLEARRRPLAGREGQEPDRKSTRLNSSH